jgi:ParB/RepB/Spo0J family partition protein
VDVNFVKLQQIDQSFPFCYHYEIENHRLTESIKATGILYPLILVKNQKYYVMDGHRRLIAARAAGLNEVQAFVYDNQQTEAAFLMGLQANLTNNDLTTIEKLRGYLIGKEHFNQASLKKVNQLLGIDRITGLEQIAEYILKYSPKIQQYLHRQNLSMRSLQQLQLYPEKEYQKWIMLGDSLNLKSKELLNILEQVQDISIRDKLKAQIFLDSMMVQEILKSDRTPQQKVQALKSAIFTIRFPLLNRIQKLVQTEQKEIEKMLGPEVRLFWDQTLEKSGALLQIILNDQEQVNRLMAKLVRPDVQDKINKLLDRINILPEET